MTSVLSTSSDVPFLRRLAQAKTVSEQSRSKRLYTFVHYEHSTHPRCYVVLFFLIVILTLALGWLIAGLVRLRQTASYLESCASGRVQCLANTDLTCSPTAFQCLCPEQTYWNDQTRKCSAAKRINEMCAKNQECRANEKLLCHSNGTCQCPANTYHTITGCTAYALLGALCLAPGSLPCNNQLGLVCDSGTQRCICPPNTFWSGARCELGATYGGYCEQNSSCNVQVGLFCQLPGSTVACDCPLPSKLYTCDCLPGQAWVAGGGLNSTSSCVNQGTYRDNCTSDSQCPQAFGLVCINGVCDCNVPLWFWSSTLGQCYACEAQGYILLAFASQWVCTRLVSTSLMTYAASQAACAALGWSLISPVFGSDIAVISRAYPTHRLWIDVRTSLGSSIYVNNAFPGNQSNWTALVSTSPATVYSTYVYAAQIVSTYDKARVFEGNTNVDQGHALCALY